MDEVIILSKKFVLFFSFVIFLTSFVLACDVVGEINNTDGTFCDVDLTWKNLGADGTECLNDYECSTNSCIDGICGEKYSVLVDKTTELSSLWELLSGENCDKNFDVSYKCEGTTAFLCGANNVWENKGQIEGVCGYTAGGNTGDGSGGGSSGGGGGGSFVPRTPQEVREVLEPESVCGDGVCDLSESSATCSEDCPAIEKPKSWQRIVAWIILIAVILGLIVLGIIFFVRRKKKDNSDEENSPLNNPVPVDMPSE